MREQLGPDGCKPIDERFQMADGSYIIWEEIAGFLSQRFGNEDEILDVQPALFRLQPRQVRGRDGNCSRDVRLAATFRLAKLPENAAVHASCRCMSLAK